MAQGGALDDSTIAGDVVLWRLIHPIHIAAARREGTRVVSSAAFDDNEGSAMSAFRADIAGDPEAVLLEGRGLAAFTVADVRELGWSLSTRDYDGNEDPEGGPAHVFVHGRKTHKLRKRLRDRCTWAYRPPDWPDVVFQQ
jgi:hypothetical protein